MGYKEKYNSWLADPCIDEETREELLSIAEDENEIEDRFYKDLEFGTAGLRGVIGAGSNRINKYIVRRATQGMADYILKQGKEDNSVVIAFDSRHMSPEFADEAARVLAANGIRAYRFESLRPTPELSFAIRELHCIAGINITASHNPANYNGYKVYWEDGAQMTPPHDRGVIDCVNAINDFSVIKTMPATDAKIAGLYKIIGEDIDVRYLESLKGNIKNPEAIKDYCKDIKVVYTPLHGTGNIPVRRALFELGFENVYVVREQELPDGAFPTLSYPNPESAEAFVLGEKLAKEVDADLILATDPDTDRLGCHVKDSKGVYHTLTGNMSGCLLCDYVLSQLAEKARLPEDGEVISSIVTTNMVSAIAEAYGVKFKKVLTGFKWIGREALRMETEQKGELIFAMEESYGCLIGSKVRDKDAVAASMALCEAACYYRSKGMNLWDAMLSLYEKYGYYTDGVYEKTLYGSAGQKMIGHIMDSLRTDAPEKIGNQRILKIRDYQTGKIIDTQTGAVLETGLPTSNVLYYELPDDAWVCVRPSGTEPKIKMYYGIKGRTFADAAEREKELNEAIEQMFDALCR